MKKSVKKFVSIVLVLITFVMSLDVFSLSVNAYEYSDNQLSQQVYLSDSILIMKTGEQKLLHVYSNSSSSLQNSCEFSSSDTSVATVDKGGMIKAVGCGKATITATVKGSGEKASCTVDVIMGNSTQPTTEPSTAPTATEPTTAEPTTVPPTTVPPTTAPSESYPVTLNSTSGTMYKGNYFQIIASCKGKLTWTSSDTSVATVSDGIVTGKSAGTAIIKVSSPTHTVQFKITVKNPAQSVNILKNSISLDRYKTYFLSSSTSGVKWKSSNTNVATVSDGYVLGKNAGKAVISAYTSNGEATCLVTVNPSAPIRFVYTSANSAALNSNVTFVAITDTSKTAVKFEVNVNGKKITVNANSKTQDNDVYVWKGTQKMTSSGEFKVVGYSQEKNSTSWKTCKDAEATAFVTKVTDKSITSCEKRRASNELISLIADYEGFRPNSIGDDITGDPTLGHGVLVFPGETFYNDLTRSEAYAHLVTSINNDGYTSKVNEFLINNNIKFNQYQYDALVCFVYNLGYGVLFSEGTLRSTLLDCYETQPVTKPAAGVGGYVSGDYVNLRAGSSLSSEIIDCMRINTQFTFVDGKLYDNEWYKIKRSDGTTGYIYYEYASVKTNASRNLDKVNKNALIKAVLQYHHAAGDCYWGLLYRRVDEMEIFFYHDYARDGRDNKHNISFACKNNPSFSI